MSVTDELADELTALAEFSSPGPGVTRLAYSDEDAAAREWFASKCAVTGLTFGSDRVGNCYGLSPGAELQPAVVMGSHLDSVVEGGSYDGTVGVVVAFEVARRILATDPDAPLAVVSFACEESVRFGIGAVGSRIAMGELDEDDLAGMRTTSGVPFEQLLRDAQVQPEQAFVPRDDLYACYLEVHIDQGGTLASEEVGIGLVGSIAGDLRTAMTWTGSASHAGAEPHRLRRDALLAASEFLLGLERLWEQWEANGQEVRITVGKFDVAPNNPNTVPGEVRLVVDLRCADNDELNEVHETMVTVGGGIAERRDVSLAVDELGRLDAVRLNPAMHAMLSESAAALGIPVISMVSFAGHDAMVVGKRHPAALLFVANPAGVSHSPAEDVDMAAVEDAVRVLVEAMPGIRTSFVNDGSRG